MSLVQSSHSRTQRLAAYAIIAVGLLWRWPLLYTGFTVDDYAQLAMIEGTYPVPRPPLSLFTFSDGSAAENTRLREAGFFPWWSDPNLRVSLLRPLSSALMWLDASAMGGDAFKYHLHSAVWWLAMLLALWHFLRHTTTGWASVLALGLIVAHPTHNVLLGWVASRNAQVSTLFVLLGLIAQLRAQREAWRPGYWIAAAMYSLSVLASEYATSTLAYAVCLSLVGPAAPARRGRTLAVWCACALGYLALRSGLGYGTRGSGMYIDPLREPLAFLSAATQRFPIMVGDAVLAVRSSWWSAGFPWAFQLAEDGWLSQLAAADLRPLRTAQVALGVVACLVGFAVAWRCTRNRNRGGPDLLFLCLGMPLALLPSVGSLPESRLMLPALIGWSAVLAQTFVLELPSLRTARSAAVKLRGVAICLLLGLELVLPPWTSADEIEGMPRVADSVRASILTAGLDPFIAGGRTILLATAADPTTTIYISLVRSWHRRPVPASCQLLMGGWGRLRLQRTSENAFEIERLHPHFTAPDVYASAFNRAPLLTGQRFQSPGFHVSIERALEGRPMLVRYQFAKPLEVGYTLLAQTEHGLQPIAFPPVGMSVIIPPANLPLLFGH